MDAAGAKPRSLATVSEKSGGAVGAYGGPWHGPGRSNGTVWTGQGRRAPPGGVVHTCGGGSLHVAYSLD